MNKKIVNTLSACFPHPQNPFVRTAVPKGCFAIALPSGPTAVQLRLKLRKIGLVLAALVLAACGGGAPAGVSVKAEDLKFTPNALTAKVGQAITVNMQNAGALEHSFIIDELNVRMEKVQPGQNGSVTFTASTAGTYTIYCDVPGHKEAGMTGTLTVN